VISGGISRVLEVVGSLAASQSSCQISMLKDITFHRGSRC
jgi:hypothetical protein